MSNAHHNRVSKKKKRGRKQEPWWSPSQIMRGLPITPPEEETDEE